MLYYVTCTTHLSIQRVQTYYGTGIHAHQISARRATKQNISNKKNKTTQMEIQREKLIYCISKHTNKAEKQRL